MEEARSKVRTALGEAILSLCNSALDYSMELNVEGLLGVTIDKQEVFLVSVNEVVRSQDYEDLLAEPTSPPASPTQKDAPRGMSKRSYMKQLVKRRSAMRKAATIAKVKTWKMTEKLKETEQEELLRELIPDMQNKKSELVTLPMLKGAPPKKRIRELSFSDENTPGFSSSPPDQNGDTSDGAKEETLNHDWIPPQDQDHQNTAELPLPDPMTSPDKADMIRIMNEVVGYNFMRKKESRKKRGEYNNYSSEVRLRIGQFAAANGIPAALRHFKKEFGRPVSDSTVRSLRRTYISAMDTNKSDPDDIKELPKKDRGRPLKLKEYDREVLDYIDNIRKNGGTINVQIVMDAARGVLLHKAKHKLKEFGGKIEITKGWADSFIRRMKHAGYIPDQKTSRKDEDVQPEEGMPQKSSTPDQVSSQANSNQGTTVVLESRTSALTPALSEQSYNSTNEPPPQDTFEHVNNSMGFHHAQNQQLHDHLQSVPSPAMIQHHHQSRHHSTLLTAAQHRQLHSMATSGIPLTDNLTHTPTTHATHTLLQPHPSNHNPHIEPQNSPELDDRDYITNTQQQISPRFNQTQLSPRDYSQSAASYLNPALVHLRPHLDSAPSPLFHSHRTLEHMADAAGYMGAMLHTGRGEPLSGREDIEHRNEAGTNGSYDNMPPGVRLEQHGYMNHVMPPSGRNHSQHM